MAACEGRSRAGHLQLVEPDEGEHALTPEEQMARFMIEAERYRQGLPHALTVSQLVAVEQAKEDARQLVSDLRAAGPGADVGEVVDAFIEEEGGHTHRWTDAVREFGWWPRGIG